MNLLVKWGVIPILILFALVLVSFLVFFSKPVVSKAPSPTINVSYGNFAEVISKNSMVKALPENSDVLLSFYNFNSGERIVEKSFIIEPKIKETNRSEAEVVVFIHSKYLSELTNKNLCAVIKKANSAGDLEISFSNKSSEAGLMWKYKSLMKYTECI